MLIRTDLCLPDKSRAELAARSQAEARVVQPSKAAAYRALEPTDFQSGSSLALRPNTAGYFRNNASRSMFEFWFVTAPLRICWVVTSKRL